MYVDTYIKNLFELGLKPLVTLPTKVNMENIITQFSIIDHIWVSEGLRSDLSCIIPVNISDHFPVISLITTDFQEISPVSLKRRRFIARGKEAFRIFLSNVSINNGGNSMNFIYDEYFRKVFDGYNRAFPIQNYVRKTKQASPWMTARLKECIRKKSKLYKGYLKGRVSKEEYTWFKNKVTSAIRKTKALFYAQMFLQNANNSKALWSSINSVMNRNDPKTLREIRINGGDFNWSCFS